jgi:membrane-anchored protein YejM (alkaline phosphatase superfamily)
MSVLDKFAQQIYAGNRAWFDVIIKYISDTLASEKTIDNAVVFLYLDHGLTVADMSFNAFDQTYNMIKIVFASVGIIVEKVQLIKENKIYNALSIDCKILYKKDKFDTLKI